MDTKQYVAGELRTIPKEPIIMGYYLDIHNVKITLWLGSRSLEDALNNLY